MTPLLEASALHYAYPGSAPALTGLSLRIAARRRLAILGPNGAGKTTLLLHLNGTLRPSEGEVRLDGRAVGYGRSDLAAWRRRVGLVLQDADDQLFAASVAEDVSFGPLNLGLDEGRTRARVEEALRALAIADLAERPPHGLSHGQKKRVAIAGALAMAPEALLLDEPTAGLDHESAGHLVSVMERLAAAGTTLVFTTHDVDLAYAFADDVALFDAGRVLAQGPALEVLADDALLASARLAPPFVRDLARHAQALGALTPDGRAPRSRDEILALFETLAAREDGGTRAPAPGESSASG